MRRTTLSPENIDLASGRFLKCSGSNFTITLDFAANVLAISQRGIKAAQLNVLPVDRIRAVVIQRKSVMPFASLTVMSVIATLIVTYNGLWPFIKLTSENIATSSVMGAIAAAIFAVPTLSRIFFVNVSVTWDGQPASSLVRFVPSRCGRRLASAFLEMSNEN